MIHLNVAFIQQRAPLLLLVVMQQSFATSAGAYRFDASVDTFFALCLRYSEILIKHREFSILHAGDTEITISLKFHK